MGGRLAAVVSGGYPPGVYRWRSRAHVGAVGRELAGAGWAGYALAGGLADAGRLFEACAGTLSFPSWFGHTWEGLATCLGDLSWLAGSGHVLLWERYGSLARADQKSWRLAYEVFEGAMAVRIRYRAVPLYVLLRGAGPEHSPLSGAPIPVLPAVSAVASRSVNAGAGSRPRRAR
jgi:hypothetical protein